MKKRLTSHYHFKSNKFFTGNNKGFTTTVYDKSLIRALKYF